MELSKSLLNTPDATTPEINNSDVEESLNAEVELNHEKQPGAGCIKLLITF